MAYPLVIIGGGLSGLAAGIRFARFGQKVCILEKHHIPGGLNSYYYRQGRLLETGLHAMTNFAKPDDKSAPLNRLFRQLKISRKEFSFHEQIISSVCFPDGLKLDFSNDIALLKNEIRNVFPAAIDPFEKLISIVNAYDPFEPRPWLSTRQTVSDILGNDVLLDMVLLPLMMYGNSNEHDMDFSQFVIMFRAIFQDGFFRPSGTIKGFLDLLLQKYKSYGGEILFNTEVDKIVTQGDTIQEIRTVKGENIPCENIISTVGYPGTLTMTDARPAEAEDYIGKMSFVESVYFLSGNAKKHFDSQKTIIFYNFNTMFDYVRPAAAVDPQIGVICFPGNFQGLPAEDVVQLRITHPANYTFWKNASRSEYDAMKQECRQRSQETVGKIIGNFKENIVYEDTFTPVTIEKFTGKREGAVYGSPIKIKDGRTPYENLFIAGTDQGYLGIVGSMLSGVTIVNQHILGKV